MKRKTALLLIVTMLFSVIFSSNYAVVNAAEDEEKHEYTDQYNGDSLLAQYSTAEIAAMYPEFSSYLARELRELKTDISVREFDIRKEDIGAIYFSVVCENPDIFYVFSTRFETTANYGTGKIVSIRPEYFFNLEDIPAKIEQFNQKVDNILKGVTQSWSDIIKARYIHDMLAHYTEYDTKYEEISDSDYDLFRVQMRIYTAYGALVDNNAVCEGYALAYKYLLSRVGVKAYYIQSVKKRHAWNMVQTGGKFYHVDITHDDPTCDNLGRVNHDNFFKSDRWVLNDGDNEHTDWITNLKADDTTFDNAWWNSVNTMIYRSGDYDYYINQVYTSSVYAALTRREISTGAEEVIAELKTRWKVKDIPNAFWERAFSYVTSDGKYFYYNDTTSVYRTLIGGTGIEKVYTKPSSNSNDIYGVAFKSDGQLYATIKENPNVKDVVYKLNITAEEPDTNPTNPTEPQGSTAETTEPVSENFTQPTTAPEPTTSSATEPASEAVTVIKRSITLYLKHSSKLTITPKVSYTFSSSKKSVATVTISGVITAKKAGKAVITAKGASVIFKITVTVKNPRLNVTKKTIKKKNSFTLKVIGGSGKITYKVGNSKIVKINTKGKVTGKKKGKTTITVTVCGLKLKCKVTVE